MLHIKPTHNSPEVIYDAFRCELSICGMAYSENPREFIVPVLSIIEDLPQTDEITLKFDFKYVNSAAIKNLLEVIRLLKKRNTEGTIKKFTLEWTYTSTDDDIIEIIQDIRNRLNVDIKEIISE